MRPTGFFRISLHARKQARFQDVFLATFFFHSVKHLPRSQLDLPTDYRVLCHGVPQNFNPFHSELLTLCDFKINI